MRLYSSNRNLALGGAGVQGYHRAVTTTEEMALEAAWEAAAGLVDEAAELLEAGRAEDAEAVAADAAERLRDIVGVEHPDYANARVVSGDIAAALGRPALAEAAYHEALAIYSRFEGDDADVVRPFRVEVLTRVAYQMALAGRYADSEAAAREAIREAERIHGVEDPAVAGHWNGLGVSLRFAGRWDDAAAAYQRAGSLREAAGMPQPATHFHNLSGLATARGEPAAAERWARLALETRLLDEGRGFAYATDLCGLADALSDMNREHEAVAAYREALAIYADTGRAEHPEAAYALHNLADALERQGDVVAAEESYRASLALKRRVLGPAHYEVAATLNNLAALLFDAGRAEEARAAAQEALRLAMAGLPEGHPVRVACERTADRDS